MDSDLSLIEIAGEDDSLLLPIPAVSSSDKGGRNTNTANYFLCSPLQVPRSNFKPIDAIAANKENFSVDGANKENYNMEKSETLKLSVEPQQMKRKKKGGGYNLRKSLAWDRAFFTEEGVLDASELSMISGNFSKSDGQTLSAIQEEDVGNSADLQTLEETLFKELPASKKGGANLLPKKRNNEASTSVASRKVLLTRDVNRSGSKRSACTRPVASSSLKRPANSVTAKASEKDSKVSKLPVQKSHPGGPSGIGKSYIPSASDSKRSHITRRRTNTTVNTQKYLGLRGSSNNTKSVPNNSKAGPAGNSLSTKTSLGQAKRNVLSSGKCSPVNMQLPSRTEAQNSVEINTNPSGSSNGHASTLTDGGSAKIPMPPSQHTEIQIAKPTGLRMPSPSLGFFTQSTAVAQSPLKMTSQLCKAPASNMSNLRKPGIPTPVSARKPPLAPRSLPKVTIDGTTTENIKASSSCSRTSTFPTFNPAVSEIMESNPQVTDARLLEKIVKSSENNYESIKDLNKLQSIFVGVGQQSPGIAEQRSGKATFESENMTLLGNDQSFVQKKFQQLDKNDTDMKAVHGSTKGTKKSELENLHCMDRSGSTVEGIDCSAQKYFADLKLAEGKPYSSPLKDQGVSSELTSGKSTVKQLPEEQAEVEHHLLHKTSSTLIDSQMLQENVADASPFLKFTEKRKEYVITPAKVTRQSNMEHLGAQSSDASITENISHSILTAEVNVQQKMVVNDVTEEPELLEFPKSLLEGEHAFQDGGTLRVDDCFLSEKSVSSEEAKQENVPLCGEPEGKDTQGGELNRSSDPCLLPGSLVDCGSDEAKLVECQNQDSPSASIDSKAVVENDNSNTQFQHDVGIHEETTLMELGNMEERHLADVGSAEDVNATCQNSAKEIHFEGDASTDLAGQAIVEDIKLTLSVDSPCHNSNSQPEENLCPEHEDSLIKQIFELVGEDDVVKHREDQDKQVIHSCCEVESITCDENQRPEVGCLMLEEPQELNVGNIVSVYPEISIHNGLESHGFLLPERMDHVFQGLEEISNVIKKEDEICESQYSVNQTEENKPVSVPGVGLGPVSQDNCCVEVFNKKSETTLESQGDCETEKMDHELMESEGLSYETEQYFGSELQDPIDQTEEVPLRSSPGVGKNDATQENSAGVQNTENDFEIVLEQGDDREIEPKISVTYSKKTPTLQGDDLGQNTEAEPLKVEASVTANLEIQPSVETLQLSQKQEIGSKLSKVSTSKPDSCAEQSDNQASVESTHDREDEDAKREHKKSGADKKQENLVIKPPVNAVPFSDEWLAAFEAAGEEILTMKSGAVQNSPQDRSRPEPGPWSPVKRKHNQTLGPFDCTKHTNH